MRVECSKCERAIQLAQPYPYAAGMSDVSFAYHETLPAVLVIPRRDERWTELTGGCFAHDASAAQLKRVEDALMPYHMGGHFRFDAKPRCPLCNAEFEQTPWPAGFYVCFGEMIDSTTHSVWEFEHDEP